MTPSVLITGASGFVGSHLVEMALNEGYTVWAAVRKSSSRKYLTDQRINIIELNLNDATELDRQISDFIDQNQGKAWDYVVHAAGATKARSEADFLKANYEATRNLADTLIKLNATPERFVLISSLSAVPMSNGWPKGNVAETAYGRSKLKAEEYIKSTASHMDHIILRPTGVYGPRETDYFLMAKSIKQHTDFSVGFKPQQITFIYVTDLCKAILSSLAKGKPGAMYQLSDGKTYSSRDFSLLLQKEIGTRWVMHITVPLWLLKTICWVSEWFSHITHKMTAINKDKYNILKQRDWRCDISAAQQDLDFKAEYDLAAGVAETVSWYKKEKWI